MKKICYITTIPATIESFFVPQLRYLSSEFEVTVICSPSASLQGELGDAVRFIPVNIPRGISLLGSFSAIGALIKIFTENQFDLIQYSTPNAAFYASIAARITKAKVRNYHCMGFRYLGFSGIKRTLFKSIEKVTCALSTHIECVSESNRKLGIAEGLFSEDKAIVVYHGSTGGVDLQRFDYAKRDEYRIVHRKECGYDENDIVCGFVGRITKDKGICELFRAFESIAADHENAKLALIGSIENSDSGISIELLEETKANRSVQFLGSKMNIQEYYPMMDMLILPSYREGFGNVVIEAEAMGVPVVVTAIPGPLDTMVPNETGLCCRVKDAEDLKAKIEILVENPELRMQLGQNAHEYAVSHFDSEKLCEKILERKKQLLGE